MAWENTVSGVALAIVLLLAGCSKRTAWDYAVEDGDVKTLMLYGQYGWELVTVSPTSDGMSEFIFKREAGVHESENEIAAIADDQVRILDKQERDAMKPEK